MDERTNAVSPKMTSVRWQNYDDEETFDKERFSSEIKKKPEDDDDDEDGAALRVHNLDTDAPSPSPIPGEGRKCV